jgi:hypothetical protein
MAANRPEESFLDKYGEPSNSIQGIGSRPTGYDNPAFNGANSMGDAIPIDTSIQHYELPNLTQRKLWISN